MDQNEQREEELKQLLINKRKTKPLLLHLYTLALWALATGLTLSWFGWKLFVVVFLFMWANNNRNLNI